MVTKYNTGDKVLIEATITEAFQNNGKIYYRVKECDIPIGEHDIKDNAVRLKATVDTSEIEAEVKKAEKLRDTLEKAIELADSIAHKDLLIRLSTIVDNKPAELARITTE